MTFSIVARDPKTGDLGVAVATAWFAVGSAVPWARCDVGAIATQSFTNRSWGRRGLQLLREGKTAAEALDSLVQSDPDQQYRQVGLVDSVGHAAAHSGSSCVPEAGQVVGDGFAVQANMMQSARVWTAMAEAYDRTEAPLARRLTHTLRAGQEAGGDFRGLQSAALLVVRGGGEEESWTPISDIRIDDHPHPLDELERLLDLEEGYQSLTAGIPTSLFEGMPETHMTWAHALAAAHAGELQKAQHLVDQLIELDPHWRESVRVYGERGLFPNWQDLIA